MKRLQIELGRSSLMQALQSVMRAVTPSSPLPILQGLHIEAKTDGVRFTASSGSLTIQVTVPQDGISAKVGRTGEAVVPASYFYNVIRKLDDEAVRLEITEPERLTIVSGSFRMRLCGMDPAEFPVLHDAPQGSFGRLPLMDAMTLFRSAVKQVAAVASTSDNRLVLTGVRLEYDEDRLKLTATDGIRLASRSLLIENVSCGSFDIIVPTRHLQEIMRITKDTKAETQLEVYPNRIRMASDGMKIESVLISGTFPFVKKENSEAAQSEIRIDRTGLLKAVERAALIDGRQTIKLAAASDRLELSSRSTGIGEMANEVPILAGSGDAFALSLNGRLLLELLRSSDSEQLRLRYAGKNAPLAILPDDPNDSGFYLMTSIRTPED